jgi:hypothetical protein
MSNSFPVQNSLKQGDALSPSLLKLALGYTVRKVQGNQEGLELKRINRLLVCASNVNLSGEDKYEHTVKAERFLACQEGFYSEKSVKQNIGYNE